MLRTTLLLPTVLALLAPSALAQTYADNVSDVPTGAPDNLSRSENVDFADVDGDGDFDAAFADGGDGGPDQNRLWINQGGAQAGVEGVFLDRTTLQFPAINDQSRDVEFADFDGDGDPDLYVSNASTFMGTPSRFWVNAGAHSGTFVDGTAERWVSLGTGGSSVHGSLVLMDGGFVDWSGDGDFADLDDDGDLDLVHTSYGSVFNGQVPTRIFRNNGLGYFREFNPSGFQLAGASIQDGNPGLWCEGTQLANTTISDGTRCDVATTGVDVDLGDTDGDFDVDMLLGAVYEVSGPRMFQNRLEENGGSLGFRDVTGAVFPAPYFTNSGRYEQELGDLDGDGDLDVYGVNWWNSGFDYSDVTLENLGDGTFGDLTIVMGPDADDEEADFLDYDADGDLDVFVANFSGEDVLLRNDTTAGSGIVLTDVSASELPPVSVTSRDGEVCDVDGDGDPDVFVAAGAGSPARNVYYENVSQLADVHAPTLPAIEDAPDRAAGPDPTSVRVHVYDNAPYYVVWYYAVELEYQVDGGPVQTVPMASYGGQVFRGEIPGSVVGFVEYRAVATDREGNQGMSPTASYTASPDQGVGTLYCFGDGSGAPCPCHNEGQPFHGCANDASHAGAQLVASGSASLSAGDLVLRASHLVPNQPGLYFQGDQRIAGGAGVAFGDGLRCAGGGLVRLQIPFSNGAGESQTTIDVGAKGGAAAGETKRYQLWYRDPAPSPCGNGFNLTNGLEIVWQP